MGAQGGIVGRQHQCNMFHHCSYKSNISQTVCLILLPPSVSDCNSCVISYGSPMQKKQKKNSPFTSKILPFIKTHLRMWRKAHLFQKCSVMCFFWKHWNQFLGNITAINKEYVSSFTFETAINVAVLYILISFLDFCLEETQHETWWWTEWNTPSAISPRNGHV